MLTFLALFLENANAETPGATLDPALLATEVVRQGIELQALQAERDALAAQCAKECGKTVVAPAPKPKTMKPAPKAIAPKPAAPAPVVPNAEIAELREEIAELRERLDSPPAITVNITLPSAPPAPVNETEAVSETSDVVSDARFQVGVAETALFAKPIPGSQNESWVNDGTTLDVRYSWLLAGKTRVAIHMGGGYGFYAGASVVEIGPQVVLDLGDTTSLYLGVDARGVCENVFNGNLCSTTRIGGEGVAAVGQQLYGPLGVELRGFVGYEVNDDAIAGPGGRLNGGAAISLVFGQQGSGGGYVSVD